MIFKRKTIRALAVSLTIAIVLLSSLMLFSTAQVTQAPPLDANYIGQTLGTQVVIANNQTGIVTAVLVRQSPTITINGTAANNFTLMNSVAEFMIPPGSTNNQTVYARGFFGLLENETNTAIRQAVTYNMTILNLHPFALQDQPKLQFLHWETRGNLTTILTNLKNIVGNTSIGTTPPVKVQTALNATYIGNRLNGTVVNGSVVDVIIPRMDANITELSNPGIVLNNFTSMSTSFEFMASNTTTSNASSGNVTVMGDFALKETELNAVETVLMNSNLTVGSSPLISNITITAIHDHTLMETPQMVYLHFMMMGDLNQTINILNEALSKTSTRGNVGPVVSPTPTPSSTVTPTSTPTNITSNATIAGNTAINVTLVVLNLGTQDVLVNNRTGIVTAVLVRQVPTVMLPNGTIANNFTLMNSVVEFQVPPGSIINQTVYARGFFGLLENETNLALRQAVEYNMTILNLHPFAIQDQPKLQFLHWETRGNFTTILANLKNIVGNTTIGTTPAIKPQTALNATYIGSRFNGTVVNDSVVDVTITRQDGNITEASNPGIVLNGFSSMSTTFEFMPMVTGNVTNASTGNVTVMGDFALKESEVNAVERVLMNSSLTSRNASISNITITAIHSHTLMETPKMVFLHFMMTGELNQTINVLSQALNTTTTSGVKPSPTPTPSTSTSPSPSASASTSGIPTAGPSSSASSTAKPSTSGSASASPSVSPTIPELSSILVLLGLMLIVALSSAAIFKKKQI